MSWKRIALAVALAGSLAAAPLAGAAARPWHHWHHRGPGIWPFVAGAAVLGTAAALTAPRWAPYPYPYYYYAPPAYYAPPPAPVYYYPTYNVAYPYW